MGQAKTVSCELDQFQKNYDKEVPQEAVMEEKKTICRNKSSLPSSGTLGKVSE
jgi:hypothetical protein